MALSLLLLAASLAGGAARLALLACLWREPELRAHFLVLAAAYGATSLHGASARFGSAARPARGGALAALVLLAGLAPPLLQLLHLLDTVASWWSSEGPARRPLLAPAPLDLVLEGLAFLCVAAHLQFGLLLGRLAPPKTPLWGSFGMQEGLALALATSLLSTAAGLLLWDASSSLRLSRGEFAWPGPRPRGGRLRRALLLLAHLSFRAMEVSGKASLLALAALLWGPQSTLAYLLLSYLAYAAALLLAEQPVGDPAGSPGHLGEACLLAFPLLFANLAQFVDCPKHLVAAKRVAGTVCILRSVELAIALGATVATILLEDEWEGDVAGDIARDWLALGSEGASSLKELSVGPCKHALAGWGLFLVAHYLCLATGWAVTAHFRGACEAVSSEDFYPPATGLAPLLLSAACARPPVACEAPSCRCCCCCAGRARAPSRRLRIEDFEVLELIGRGEFGEVFRARQRETGQVFAMKRLSKEFHALRRMSCKVVREATMLAAVRGQPFAVQLFCALENSREWALVMEYCPKGDLQQLLVAEGIPGLSLDRTLYISAEVALALEHLHALGIVFRDLKLENVVLDGAGHAKLTDFGLAKRHWDGKDAIAKAELAGGAYERFTRTFCGSYGYVAPEVNPQRLVHGFAADLYSFGVLLFMLLAGGEVCYDKRQPPVETRLPPERPLELQSLIDRLSFDFYWASHHLLGPAAAAHRLQLNLEGETVLVRRGPRGLRRQARPHRPPTSPLEQEPHGSPRAPASFPLSARSAARAARRRWDLALDLVRRLTKAPPESRGTVASLKRHAFFSEEIPDWRALYPRSWLVANVERRLQGPGGPGLPEHLSRWLERMTVEELVRLQDEPELTLDLLLQRCPLDDGERGPRASRGEAVAASLPNVAEYARLRQARSLQHP